MFTGDFENPAWGINHCRRVYDMSMKLADAEKTEVDEEALFAAAYLHDMGAFQPYKELEIDHADRSEQLCEEELLRMKFPVLKIPLVKEIIKHHMFYAVSGKSFESAVFRDADILDFMGVIGITRILSIVGLDDWTPDLISAVDLIKKLSLELQDLLFTSEGKKIGAVRKAEMEEYLKALSEETEELKYM